MLFTRHLLPKQIGFKKSRLYNQSRVDFYTGRNKLSIRSSLRDVVYRDTLHTPITDVEITTEQFTFGIHPKELLSKKGKANFKQDNHSSLPGLEAYFFRKKINDIKCIQQYHFFKNQFFYGHVEFRNCHTGFEIELKEMLRKKHELLVDHISEAKDKEGNLVWINAGISPSLNYLTGSEEILNAIKFDLEHIEEKKSALHLNKMEKLFDLI